MKDERKDVISFKLLGKNISFGRKDCDIITRLSYRARRVVEFEHDKAFRVQQVDSVKIPLFYLIKLVMTGRERGQHMDWIMLSLIDNLEDFFISYDSGELIWVKILGSLKGALNGKVALHKKRSLRITSPQSHIVYIWVCLHLSS